MLTLTNLNKSFQKTQVLNDLNAEFKKGSIYGIIGKRR